jgi:hypothetical protein
VTFAESSGKDSSLAQKLSLHWRRKPQSFFVSLPSKGSGSRGLAFDVAGLFQPARRNQPTNLCLTVCLCIQVRIRYWVSRIGIGFGIGIRAIVASAVVSAAIITAVITGVSWCFGLFGRFFGNLLYVPSGRIGYTPPRWDRWTSGWWHGILRRVDVRVRGQIGVTKSKWRILGYGRSAPGPSGLDRQSDPICFCPSIGTCGWHSTTERVSSDILLEPVCAGSPGPKWTEARVVGLWLQLMCCAHSVVQP